MDAVVTVSKYNKYRFLIYDLISKYRYELRHYAWRFIQLDTFYGRQVGILNGAAQYEK